MTVARYVMMGAAGGGPSALSPGEISGLLLWLEADSGITKDGSNNISAWADQSPEANNTVNGTVKPILVDSVFNGKPIVRFASGVNDYMFGDATGFPIGGAASTLFIVSKRTVTSGLEALFAYGTNTTGNAHAYAEFTADATFWGASNDVTLGASALNAVLQHTMIYTGANLKYWQNSTNLHDASHTINTTLTQPDFFVGQWIGPTTATGFRGDIAAVIFYNSALSDADRVGVEIYLQDKYGI